jgi:hypothetical protein
MSDVQGIKRWGECLMHRGAGAHSLAIVMFSVSVTADCSASPDEVIALAGTDFSPHRAKVWPNVTNKRLAVHARGDTFVDVTEGGTGIAWLFWERCRYDWSCAGTVKATVIESNVLEPGSTFELRVTPAAGGTKVEMTLDRRFRRSLAGRTAASSTTSPASPVLGGCCAAQ